MVTGAHPILPLDIQEATWLVKLPDCILMTEELIGYHARALAKHRTHVAEMCRRVTLEKIKRVVKYELNHHHKISNHVYKPEYLVLIYNSMVASSLNSKLKPRYCRANNYNTMYERWFIYCGRTGLICLAKQDWGL